MLIEFDGTVKYTDGGSDALFREKRREDRIRALGYVVVRVIWADLFHPEVGSIRSPDNHEAQVAPALRLRPRRGAASSRSS